MTVRISQGRTNSPRRPPLISPSTSSSWPLVLLSDRAANVSPPSLPPFANFSNSKTGVLYPQKPVTSRFSPSCAALIGADDPKQRGRTIATICRALPLLYSCMTLGESIFLEGRRIRVFVMSLFEAQDATWIFMPWKSQMMREFDVWR